jgi:hypothetical protein
MGKSISKPIRFPSPSSAAKRTLLPEGFVAFNVRKVRFPSPSGQSASRHYLDGETQRPMRLIDSFCFFFTRRRPFGLKRIRFRPAPQWLCGLARKAPAIWFSPFCLTPLWKEMESIWATYG